MADGKGLNPMIIGGIILGLVAVGLVVYFVFFRNKKDDDGENNNNNNNNNTTFDNTPSSAPSTTTIPDDVKRDTDMLSYIGNDINYCAAAYSLRRQLKEYPPNRPIVDLVKNLTATNPEYGTFYAAADGSLQTQDGQKLDGWNGARMVVWYDQSGNDRHAHATQDHPVTLMRTDPGLDKPSYWAFNFGGHGLAMHGQLTANKLNNSKIFTNATMTRQGAKLRFDTPVATVFVFDQDPGSSTKNFFSEDRNPSLRLQ